MRTGPMNYQLQQVLQTLELPSQKSAFWQRVVSDIKKPTRQRREVNIYKIDRCAQPGETVVVPGKVLSLGTISKKVDVAAMSFSLQAAEKITRAKGRVMTIIDLFQENPEGKKVRILG